jgi:hypothetical protein
VKFHALHEFPTTTTRDEQVKIGGKKNQGLGVCFHEHGEVNLKARSAKERRRFFLV